MVKAYPAIFHYEENGYWVEFPDLPGCLSEGDDAAQALAQALASRKGVVLADGAYDDAAYKQAQYDLLADAVRQALDMDLIYRILEGKA